MSRRPISAVIFDLDGVIVDSEIWWDQVRQAFAAEHDRPWTIDDRHAVMGKNSRQWSETMRERLQLQIPAEEIERAVVEAMVGRYAREGAPVIDGAVDAVRRIAESYPVALASSSHRAVIDAALTTTWLGDTFGAVVSSDEVAHGKPEPDVFLEAARRLGADPASVLVVEDSLNGLRAGRAAGMTTVLVPNVSVPPAAGAAEYADVVLDRLADLDPDTIRGDPRPPASSADAGGLDVADVGGETGDPGSADRPAATAQPTRLRDHASPSGAPGRARATSPRGLVPADQSTPGGGNAARGPRHVARRGADNGVADTIHPIRRSLRTFISRSLAWVAARAIFRPRLEGRERLPPGPAVYCFNHLNWVDPFVLMATLPLRPRLRFFGPKEEDMTVGGRNRLMHWTGATIPYRPGKNDLLEATRKVHAAIASRHVVAIAGEGRIQPFESQVRPLSEGPAYFALREGVPLVPIAIAGTSWLAFGRRIRIRIGEPIKPAGRANRDGVDRLTSQCQEALAALVRDQPELSRPGPFGRWLTELFNEWPEGTREAAERADVGGAGDRGGAVDEVPAAAVEVGLEGSTAAGG